MKAPLTLSKEDNKLQYIDCLRGIAILMVILNHADWFIRGIDDNVQAFSDYGQMGVQLFFVASAFTLCLSMDRRRSDETLKTFYIRRYFRIAPLYYFGILLYLCYYCFIEPLIEGRAPGITKTYSIPNILANVFFINDFVPGDANTKVVPGGWSIGTETTFYAIFPLIFLFYKKFVKTDMALVFMPLAGLALGFLGIWVLEFIAIDLAGYENFSYIKEKTGFLYFHLLSQLSVFLVGMSLYFKSQSLKKSTLKDQYFLLFAFIGFTYIAIVVQNFHKSLIGLIPFIPAVSFFFLFLLFKEVPSLSNKLLARIGQLSYSIYLFHFIFAFEGSRFLYNQLNPYMSGNFILLINFLATTVLTMGVAVLSEKYIEKPGIEWGKRIIAKIKSRNKKVAFVKAVGKEAVEA